jgi:hypothetical protein
MNLYAPNACLRATGRRSTERDHVHRFETDPVVTVRENFVACDVLSHASWTTRVFYLPANASR